MKGWVIQNLAWVATRSILLAVNPIPKMVGDKKSLSKGVRKTDFLIEAAAFMVFKIIIFRSISQDFLRSPAIFFQALNIKRRFDQAGIEIPFRQAMISFAKNSQLEAFMTKNHNSASMPK